MNTPAFDREWTLSELLDAPTLARVALALHELLGGKLAILDKHGKVLWGELSPEARREPLVLELEPHGFICSDQAAPAALISGRQLLTALLRAELRFKMASTLHLAAVAEDFASLKREHARLLESEARYKALAEALEARVKEQVAQLEERQQMLYAAEKLAAVGQLAAGMAHEINNPLGFVHSNLNTFQTYLEKVRQLKPRLAEGEAAWQALDLDFVLDDSNDLLKDSTTGIARIARIVSDLKSFSNVDRATEEFADINTCVQQVASLVQGQLPKGISLKLDLQPLPSLICLPGHLKQLFFSLIRNAVQAIEEAGRPGSISISSSADAQGISVQVHDDGVGMSRPQLERAFEPFYTTRPVGAGAGLGLPTARNIAIAHSGRLELSSQLGNGTTVSLFIPSPS